MRYKGKCEFKNLPDSITVGTVLNLYCKSKGNFNFDKNLFIEFSDPKDKYKVHILNVLENTQGSLDLKVTSYRAGPFSNKFSITDGTSSLEVDGLSFNVKSVLPKNTQIKAHPPFGPWDKKLPTWYLSLWGGTVLLTLFFAILLFLKFSRRKKFLDKVKEQRSEEKPIKKFVKEVRRSENKDFDFVKSLEASFKTFLEELFLIEVVNKKTINQIMKEIKKYEPRIYKKYGEDISNALTELSLFRNKRSDELTSSNLKKICYALVFNLEQESLS